MNEDNDAYSLNLDGLTRFARALTTSAYARVGILGTHDSRQQTQVQTGKNTFKSQGPVSNSAVGAAHEFGTSRVPQRSFLRMPIREQLGKHLEQSGAFNPDVLKEVMKTASIVPWMEKVGKVGEAVVLDAFKTGGFGKWKSHAPGYSNNTGQLLLDTQQLRTSITSDVKTENK
jgi:phage gpG-like protein